MAAKLTRLEAITAKRTALESQIGPLMDLLHAAGSALATVIAHGARLTPPVDVTALKDFKAILVDRYRQLQKLFPLDDTYVVLVASRQIPDDDAQREYAYGPAKGLPDTKVGTFTQTLNDEAKKQGWVVISMKNGWKRIFAFE